MRRNKETKMCLREKIGAGKIKTPAPIRNRIKEKDISVIIPFYNVESFIEECTLSVLSQKGDFTWEIIFINDGSTDKSMEVLQNTVSSWEKGCAGENIPDIMYLTQENKGVGAARNAGLSASKGEYIAFVDSDDCLASPYYLSDLFCKIKEENADICMEGMIQEKDGIRSNTGWNPEWDYSNKYHSFCKCPGYLTAKLIRKDLFYGLCFPEGCFYEDTIMQLLIYPRCTSFCQINKADYVYRINRNSITYRKNKGNKGIDSVLAVDECLKMVRGTKLKTSVFWYEVFLNHFEELLFTRIRHCNFFVARNAFMYACFLTDDAALYSNMWEFRPFDGADFCLEHRLFLLWCIRCFFQKIGIVGIRKHRKKRIVKCRQYQH